MYVCGCVGANVGVHSAPSVIPQSEISPVANNSKTGNDPREEKTSRDFTPVFPRTKPASVFSLV